MGQVKVFGLASELNQYKAQLSEIIHSCLVSAFHLPADKKFHRFFPLHESDFIFPEGRTSRYTIIELSIFEGRSVETKKELIHLLFLRLQQELSIQPADVEITIFETPKSNWGIRGLPGDELNLNYKVDI